MQFHYLEEVSRTYRPHSFRFLQIKLKILSTSLTTFFILWTTLLQPIHFINCTGKSEPEQGTSPFISLDFELARLNRGPAQLKSTHYVPMTSRTNKYPVSQIMSFIAAKSLLHKMQHTDLEDALLRALIYI